jgi:UPF0042 nucleotide-binding protein
MNKKKVVILTGLSGAGKTVAIKVLEDIGFYPIDNVPIQLLDSFIEVINTQPEYEKVAIGLDIRTYGNFNVVADIAEKEHIQTIFLECSDETIIKRYKETRRSHPLCKEDDNIMNAIQREREVLAPLRENATYVINSSLMGTAKLKDEMVNLFLDKPTDSMAVKINTFGFKYGSDTEADLLFDVRCLPNPFYIKELRNKTGLNKEVADYVLSFESSQTLLEKLKSLLDFILPLYHNEGKNRLVISFGCTGGKHRSVTFAENISAYLLDNGYLVNTNHRDIKRP